MGILKNRTCSVGRDPPSAFFFKRAGRIKIKSSKVDVDFKKRCHWGSFAVTAKLAGKRARSLAGRGRETAISLTCDR
jgi:hypothetical protein